MNKLYLNWKTIDQYCNKLAIQILKSEWKPDYIVGIGRGGLVPAVILSHILEVPMHSLKVTLRDGAEEDCDHNCWMAEDAMGYVTDRRAKFRVCLPSGARSPHCIAPRNRAGTGTRGRSKRCGT